MQKGTHRMPNMATIFCTTLCISPFYRAIRPIMCSYLCRNKGIESNLELF